MAANVQQQPTHSTSSSSSSSSSLPSRCNKGVFLPNMLASTTYALNKSNSKRATVGLDHHLGYYKPVVKLCSHGTPSKYVTLDMYAWDLVLDQMDEMRAYLTNSYSFYQQFGKPAKIFLPNHDVSFTTAYGERAIIIEERPSAPTPVTKSIEPEAQQWDTQENAEDRTGPNDIETDLPPPPPPTKKQKFNHAPSIIMQLTTFEGLRDVRECIETRLKRLEEDANTVNRIIDIIKDFFQTELGREYDNDKAKLIVKDIPAFKQYYTSRRMDILNRVKVGVEYTLINQEYLEIILLEIEAYGLQALSNALCTFMFNNE